MAARAKDPLRNFKFRVEVPGFGRAGFSSVDGLTYEHEQIMYREGGDPSTQRKMPGMTKFENLILERGKADDVDFLSWMEEIYDANTGNGTGFGAVEDTFRRTITVTLLDMNGNPQKQWQAFFAWPAKYEHETLDGREGNDVLIERLEICHEGLKEIKVGT